MEHVDGRRIDAGFYRRGTLEVARDLLGRVLCRRLPDGSVLRGRLVEVEAYDGPNDRACHAWRGRTPRNAPLFGPGGLAYIYLVYGMHDLLNVVTGPTDYPAAVLLRAAESPSAGVSASGPGRLTRAFRVDRSLDRASFTGPELWIERGAPVADSETGRTARIGVDYAGSWARRRFRFVIRDHPDLSGPAALNRRARS
ncbi:MAG: DNA-3-methyladenine glycosylase [Acidobacteriota bacterium]|nr:DNA-3-methyladenine glycosylase [Acidobacteriota bacterium]